jgi:hypothetical protein
MIIKKRNNLPRSGHFPGHLREAFLAAIEAYLVWEDRESEPKITVEIHYQEREMLISEVCGWLWNCTDILPGTEYRELVDNARWEHEAPKCQTYAAAARYLLSEIKRLETQID